MCKVLNAQDVLSEARNLVEVAWMAANALQSKEEGGPMCAVLDIASDKLREAITMLGEYRAEREAIADDA
jgi:hypothetical protein